MAWADFTVGRTPFRTEVLGPLPTADNNDDANLTSEGGPYEKPIGKCTFDDSGSLIGCTCHTDALLFDGSRSDKVIHAAVCVDVCLVGKSEDCPKPPTGRAQCKPPKACSIGCNNDK
ncbi:hypothetical protein Pmar_PMAR017862, partial [Perkinsus marinus ATCC 50983]